MSRNNFSKEQLQRMFEYLGSDKSQQTEQTERFINEHRRSEAENFAVIMYMIGALNYLDDKSPDKIQEVAFELAYIGMDGIDPSKKNEYQVNSVPSKEKFSGYKAIAYYYVSWMLHSPSNMGELKPTFAKEFETAKKLREVLLP